MAVTAAPRGARKKAPAESVAGKTLADFPAIAAQLHPDRNGGLSALQILAGSNKTYAWVCELIPDHLWNVSANNRTRKRQSCPFCAGQRVSATNSLATLFPEVAAQLHPELNGGVTADQVVAGSHSKHLVDLRQGRRPRGKPPWPVDHA